MGDWTGYGHCHIRNNRIVPIMDPDALRKPYRLILNLGKYRVAERSGNTIKIVLGGSTTITINNPVLSRSDVTAGDILTLYTEIPYANVGQHT